MLRYEGFTIKNGARLLLKFTTADGGTTMLWQVPQDYDSQPELDYKLDDAGLLIGGYENIYPESIEESKSEFTDLSGQVRLALGDIKIGDTLIAVDNFELPGENTREYELRFTVTTANFDETNPDWIDTGAIEVRVDEFDLYRQ